MFKNIFKKKIKCSICDSCGQSLSGIIRDNPEKYLFKEVMFSDDNKTWKSGILVGVRDKSYDSEYPFIISIKSTFGYDTTIRRYAMPCLDVHYDKDLL